MSKQKDSEIFGRNLKRARKAKGLTQKQLAQLLGVSEAAIGMWEAGARLPDVSMASRIAKALDVPLQYLADELPSELPQTYIAFARQDDPLADLPKEARRSVEEFVEYLKAKYTKKED
jgi:transcriptional regulator with XRE-family HTH domain